MSVGHLKVLGIIFCIIEEHLKCPLGLVPNQHSQAVPIERLYWLVLIEKDALSIFYVYILISIMFCS
jgi:hypothetical protein